MFSGGRTTRMVNPRSWESGLVFGQCSHCEVWHVLASNNPSIYEEIRYTRDEEDVPVPISSSSSGVGSSSEDMEQASQAVSSESAESDLASLPEAETSMQGQTSGSNSSSSLQGPGLEC